MEVEVSAKFSGKYISMGIHRHPICPVCKERITRHLEVGM